MVSRKLRMLQLVNTSNELKTDSDNCRIRSNIEITSHKKRRLNVLSISESEEIEDNTCKIRLVKYYMDDGKI